MKLPASAQKLIRAVICLRSKVNLIRLNDRKYNIFSPIIAVIAILFFIFTENVHNPMVLVDKWTIWALIIYALEVVSRFFGRKEDDTDSEETEDTTEE